MKVTYYPGCSLESSARDYDESIKIVCRALDIHLQEPKDWTCCGATSAHSLNRKLAVDLPARNLPAAEGRDRTCRSPVPYVITGWSGPKKRQGQGSISMIWLHLFPNRPCSKKSDPPIKAPLAGLIRGLLLRLYGHRPPKITGSKNYENPMEIDRIAEDNRDKRQTLVF